MNTIESELSLNRVVNMFGSRSGGSGHSWVCDGSFCASSQTEIKLVAYVGEFYTMLGAPLEEVWSTTKNSSGNPYWHHNWGWRGIANGWYEYGQYNPSYQNTTYTYSDIKILYKLY